LGAKDSIIETIVDEIKDIPFTLKDLKSVIKQASKGELQIEVSNNQLEFISKELKDFIRPIILSFGLIFTSIFMILYDKELKQMALALFIVAIIRLIYK
jgi:ubiquinone biosynthesis protein